MIVHWPEAFVSPPVLSHVPPVIEPTPVSDAFTLTPTAGTQPFPSPRFFSTVTVKVCGSPTLFVPDVPIVIRASTHVLTLFMLRAPAPWVSSPLPLPDALPI